ncbi:MAG: branched-chain amino acid ABC transporter permease [Acutalibacteraceae bacterium]|jgi:branched-chain amino acid transport system permease protein
MKKKNSILFQNLIFCAAAVLVYLLIAYGMSASMIPRATQTLVIKACYNVILALSLNLIVGFLGELSLGHAGFFALGAYSGCIFSINSNLPVEIRFIVAALIGGTVAAIGGFLISSSILRLQGDYLAIVTLAFGEIIRSFVKILPITGGTAGLNGIPSLGSKVKTFSFSYLFVIITILVIRNIVTSRHGRAITSIRDNAIAAESVGINIKGYKIKVFAVGAFFAGVAGVIMGHYINFIEPGNFNYNISIEVLVMVVLGGMGNLLGSIIAAVIITFLPEILRDFDQYRLLIYALALIFLMLASASPRIAALRMKASEKTAHLRRKVLSRKGE